jgi:hypothetical protein
MEQGEEEVLVRQAPSDRVATAAAADKDQTTTPYSAPLEEQAAGSEVAAGAQDITAEVTAAAAAAAAAVAAEVLPEQPTPAEVAAALFPEAGAQVEAVAAQASS